MVWSGGNIITPISMALSLLGRRPPYPSRRGPQGSSMMPTCYRHSNRATGASCTRCGRPICPDCMVQAPVGHHCPECVREGNKGVRQAHWRPSPTLGGRRATPVVRALIIVNAAVFVIARPGSSAWARFAQVPYYVARGQYERLLTAAFLHAGIAHIVFNMLALYIVGPS